MTTKKIRLPWMLFSSALRAGDMAAYYASRAGEAVMVRRVNNPEVSDRMGFMPSLESEEAISAYLGPVIQRVEAPHA